MTIEQFKYTKDDNTDRDYPDAFEVIDMEFKINGEYICVEPCGAGAKHLLGDQHIYVDINGDDFIPDVRDPIRIGTVDDPFATIPRAMLYANSFVTLKGNIYIHLSTGTFYIDESVSIDHPNKIIILSDLAGAYHLIDSIRFGDSCSSESIYYWYGDRAIFGSGLNKPNIDYVSISSGVNTSLFGNSTFNLTYGGTSNSTRGILYGGAAHDISYITFAILSDETVFGTVTNVAYTRTCSDGNISINFGGYISSIPKTLIEKIIITIESNATYFGDLTIARYGGAACNNSVTGIIGGGIITGSAMTDSIEEVTIASDAHATNFGLLSIKRIWATAVSDRTYGLIHGRADDFLKNIEKINITSGSSGSIFGNLSIEKQSVSSCSNDTTGLFGGGMLDPSGYTSVIEQVTIAIESDSTNFGDFYVGGSEREVSDCEGCSGN